jgi:hypothetical protein
MPVPCPVSLGDRDKGQDIAAVLSWVEVSNEPPFTSSLLEDHCGNPADQAMATQIYWSPKPP